jgi:uncharacterized protein
MMANRAVVIMAKQPQPGRTKTRLCPPFTPQQAACFYEALLKDTLLLVDGIAGVQLAVAITPPESEAYFKTATSPGTLLLPVEGVHIGECLNAVLNCLLDSGYQKALALNADGPSLPRQYVIQALDLLDEHDLVLGPGEDGGYYLVGLKGSQPGIFEGIQWSTVQVLGQTLAQAGRLHLKTALTPPWYDIDLPSDVERLRAEIDCLPPDALPHCRRFFTASKGANR